MIGTFLEDCDIGASERAGAPSAPTRLDCVSFASSRLGFVADQVQAGLLRSGARRGILNCCRQWGKSTVAAVMALYQAVTVPKSLVIVASPTARQSGEFVRKARELYRRPGLRSDGNNKASLRFPNGSRIVGLPGKDGATIRGFSNVSLMIVDEAAYVPDSLYHALRPMLAVGDGALWLLSTPAGKSGFFHDAWAFGGDTWTRFQVTGPECGRIRKEFLEEELVSCGQAVYRREWLCEFAGHGDELFDRLIVEEAVDAAVAGLF